MPDNNIDDLMQELQTEIGSLRADVTRLNTHVRELTQTVGRLLRATPVETPQPHTVVAGSASAYKAALVAAMQRMDTGPKTKFRELFDEINPRELEQHWIEQPLEAFARDTGAKATTELIDFEAEVKKVYPEAYCEQTAYTAQYAVWESLRKRSVVGRGKTEDIAWLDAFVIARYNRAT